MINEKPILCHVNLATGYRGGERQTQLLMKQLSSLGWQQMLIARKAGILAQRSGSIDNLIIYETSLNPLQYFRLLSQADIIHLHESRAFLALWLSKISSDAPFILTRRVQRYPSLGWLNKNIYSKANAIVTISDAIGQGIYRLFDLNYTVIPDAKTSFEFNPEEVKAIRSRVSGDFIVGHIGALDDSHKGQCQIIEVAQKLNVSHPNIAFIIVGQGRDYQLFKKQSSDLENIQFVGQVENVGDYLEAFDMFLFPSRHEGLGSILLDAMDFALPVIATDVGGIPEVIEHAVNGFIVQPNAIEDMIENILRLFSNDDLLQSIGEKNKEKAQAYSVASMSKQYAQIYNKNINHN